MKKYKFFLIFIFNINSFLFLAESTDTIRFVFILTRTGAHSPSKLNKIYSNTSNNELKKDIFGYEWIGENELTYVGKRQQYYLGYHNNLRYKNILFSEIYHPKELLSMSSECNKTIQSGYANLHGLYQNTNLSLTYQQMINAVPPLDSDKGYIDVKKELDEDKYILPGNVQIVPVYTFYEKDHNYLLEKVENCPNSKMIYDEIELSSKKKIKEILDYKSDDINSNNKTYGEILIDILNEEKIFNETYDINSLLNNFTLFQIIAETFICDYFEVVNFDKFTKNGINIYKLLQMFEEFFSSISIGGSAIDGAGDLKKTEKIYEFSQKVNYGLFNCLLNWIKIRIDNDIKNICDILLYESPKIVSYFSHHKSIESLYYFLKETFNIKNATNSLYVNFTSFITIELYRKNKNNEDYSLNDFYIKFIYDNQQLGDIIPYKEFYDKINEKIISLEELQDYCGITEEEEEAEKKDNDNDNNKDKEESNDLRLKILGIILIGIFVILIFFIIFFVIKMIKQRNHVILNEEIISDEQHIN